MRSRRALSSMVGALFFIIAMTVAIGYISYSMDTFDQFAQTVIVKSSVKEDKNNEEFQVSKVTLDGNLFNITVTNTGQIPMNITRLWIENVTSGVSAADAVPKSCDIKESLGLQQVGIKIGQSCPAITASDTASYQVKLVTERGTIKEFSVNSANQQPLYIQLHAIPDTIPTGFTTTILMTVVNNMSSNNWLPDLKPNTLGISPSCTSECVKMSGPEPPVYESLEYGDEATFKWVYRIDGDADDSLTFTGSINNGLAGNDASDVVTIKIVEEAEIAGEAVTVLGVGSSIIFLNNALILHDETELTPGGAYQMDSSTPGGVGLDLTVGPGFSAQWFATNATNNDITVPAGMWNASLRYNSPRLPSDMASGADVIWQDGQEGGHIFHFNDNPSSYISDSGADQKCYDAPSLVNPGIFGNPAWSLTYGVNGTGGYYFDGIDDYMQIDGGGPTNTCSIPDANLFSMAGWFKADVQSSYDTKQVILAQYEEFADDFFDIALSDGTAPNHGVLYFTWHTDGSGSINEIQCEAVKSGGDGYMDGQWHHFVGTRYDSAGGNDCSCKLYVDGTLKHTNNTDSSCSATNVSPLGTMDIGRNSMSGYDYTGYLDDLMFWSTYELTASDVTALHQANFGPNAHEITIVLEKTDGGGTTVQTLNSTLSYPLPYVDQMHHTDLSDLWEGANATLNVPQFTLYDSVPNRLNFTLAYAGGMDMTLHIDDTVLDGVTKILSSYIQTPVPDNSYVSYFKYNISDEFVFVILNQGVPGAWYTSPGTRLIFDDPSDITKSYAAIIHFVNGTTPQFKVDDLQDSLWVHSRATGTMIFWGLKNTPTNSASNEITVGNYDAYIFVNGYDDGGRQFQKTLKLGVVSVVDT